MDGDYSHDSMLSAYLMKRAKIRSGVLATRRIMTEYVEAVDLMALQRKLAPATSFEARPINKFEEVAMPRFKPVRYDQTLLIPVSFSERRQLLVEGARIRQVHRAEEALRAVQAARQVSAPSGQDGGAFDCVLQAAGAHRTAEVCEADEGQDRFRAGAAAVRTTAGDHGTGVW